DRVARAVEFVFLFTLAGGLRVLQAAIASTQDERKFDAAIVRTLGASQRQMQSAQATEFLLLGSLAGLLGAAGATAIGYALAEHVFNIRFTGNALVWLYGIVGGAVAVTLAGWLGTRSTVNAPSLGVSLTSTLCSAVVGLPLGAAVAIGRFPGRGPLIVALNAAMGLPPVVVGLLVYLLLSRAGPLGSMGLLFTPQAMVIAQTVLIVPLVAALTRQIVEDAWIEYREQLRSLDSSWLQSTLTLLWDTRWSLLTVVLAGFGRAASEVGAVIIVGGNIDGVTRVMTTAIALETSKGDLPLALALGAVLMTLVVVLNLGAYATREWARERFG